jgi:hypothetical protein
MAFLLTGMIEQLNVCGNQLLLSTEWRLLVSMQALREQNR